MSGNKFLSDFMIVFGFIMVACYIGIGLFLLISNSMKYIDLNMRIIFASFFMVYGLFRLVRLIGKIKENRNYEND